MDILNKLREELQVERWQVEAAVKLIDEGNTIPFISRYRKEATGSLNDEVLRNLYERLNYLRNLEEKKTSVMASIEEQGKLTDDLKNKILAAETLVVVEDLYRPYRPKRKTRASVAKEKGLDGLADLIREQKFSGSLEEAAAAYVNPEKGAADTKEALQGAQDILAEGISDEADYRMYIRKITMDEGKLTSTNVKTMPYPGFPTDMQPQIAAVLCLAEGTSILNEGVWDNRYRYADEFRRMGANIQVNGKVAVIEGVRALTGAPVCACDLRAGAAMIVAGLAANGVTEIDQVYHIERGYEGIVQKLSKLGADIHEEVIPEEDWRSSNGVG